MTLGTCSPPPASPPAIHASGPQFHQSDYHPTTHLLQRLCHHGPSQDMTTLPHLHEPGVLANLQQRYEQREIYT